MEHRGSKARCHGLAVVEPCLRLTCQPPRSRPLPKGWLYLTSLVGDNGQVHSPKPPHLACPPEAGSFIPIV